MKSNQIREIVKQIKSHVTEGKDLSKFSEFKEKYPKLFAMLVENGKYDDMMNYMLESLEKVENGQVEREEMDKEVGGHLAKEYIYPNIDMTKET